MPIFAVTHGIAVRAFASDVNAAPLECAKRNIEESGVTDKISCILTSGFDGMGTFGITDAAICGMGGELIEKIIADAGDFIRKAGFRLIVQPMTRPEAARRALWRAGFYISSESVICEDGKFYTIICADFTAEKMYDHDNFEAAFGDFSVKCFESDAVKADFFAHETQKYERMMNGKLMAGIDVSAEKETIRRLAEISEAL